MAGLVSLAWRSRLELRRSSCTCSPSPSCPGQFCCCHGRGGRRQVDSVIGELPCQTFYWDFTALRGGVSRSRNLTPICAQESLITLWMSSQCNSNPTSQLSCLQSHSNSKQKITRDCRLTFSLKQRQKTECFPSAARAKSDSPLA